MDLMSFMEAMGTSNISIVAAFFIGLMTAISPCPMATNITAIAYVSKRIDNSRHTLTLGLLYALGRMTSYVFLASVIVWIGLSSQAVSFLLQDYGEKILGPFLIILGVLMLDIVKIKFLEEGEKISRLKKSLAEKGYAGSFILGVLFALAFCPFSAVLFFGMLIPLCLKARDGVILPAVFALATGLPVIVLSAMLVYGLSKIGSIMNKIGAFEALMRKTAAVVFILAGLYYIYIMYFGGQRL